MQVLPLSFWTKGRGMRADEGSGSGSGFRASKSANLRIPQSRHEVPIRKSRNAGVFPPDGPPPEPFAKREETTENELPLLAAERPLWDKPAAIGSGGDGRLGVFVERSERLGRVVAGRTAGF